MKKVKRCDHCDAKFSNRKNLLDHLFCFHGIPIHRLIKEMIAKVKHSSPIPSKETKPLRRVRMLANAMRVKKDRDRVSKIGIGAKKRQVERGVR